MEANPEKMRSIVEHQKVPDEKAAMELIKATEDQTRDRAIPAWCKGHSHKGPSIKKRRQKGLECNSGTKD
jgi:hypothetical protein